MPQSLYGLSYNSSSPKIGTVRINQAVFSYLYLCSLELQSVLSSLENSYSWLLSRVTNTNVKVALLPTEGTQGVSDHKMHIWKARSTCLSPHAHLARDLADQWAFSWCKSVVEMLSGSSSGSLPAEAWLAFRGECEPSSVTCDLHSCYVCFLVLCLQHGYSGNNSWLLCVMHSVHLAQSCHCISNSAHFSQ